MKRKLLQNGDMTLAVEKILNRYVCACYNIGFVYTFTIFLSSVLGTPDKFNVLSDSDVHPF